MQISGAHDEKTLAHLADVASRAQRVALMQMSTPALVMPIGGVAAYHDQVADDAQGNNIEVPHLLRPLIVVMGIPTKTDPTPVGWTRSSR